MKQEIKQYIKDNYPDYSVWIDDDNNLASIRKIFRREVYIPAKLITDLMWICRIGPDKIQICIEHATIPNNYDSLTVSITLSVKG